MDKQTNKYIAVAYKLYTNENGAENMVEEATEQTPFQFLSGFGLALESFENAVADLQQGEAFDFLLTKEQAFGEHEAERVLKLDREMFCIDGKLDTEHIFEGAVIPLQNEAGQKFPAMVVEIGDEKVTVDLNHPFAGKALRFVGKVLESREATNDEIQSVINHLNGGCGCGGNCGGDCGGNCGGDCEGGCGDHEGGCGHCH